MFVAASFKVMADLSGVPFEAPTIVEADENDTNECEIVRAKKQAKKAPLHESYIVPLSFIEDTVRSAQKGNAFHLTCVGEPFGLYQEAYAHSCYKDIVQCIGKNLPTGKETQIVKGKIKKKLFIIRGSSGIGKSTFLGYFLAQTRNYLEKPSFVTRTKVPRTKRT